MSLNGAPSPAKALREAFGDRKPPDISRKITACVTCRKHKIKCQMQGSGPPCVRCRERGLSCTVNRSLQMLLEDDVSWKHSMVRKVDSLQSSMAMLAEKLPMPELLVSVPESLPDTDGPTTHESFAAHDNYGAPQTWEVVMDTESGPASIPGSCVTAVPRASGSTSSLTRGNDIISRGVISQTNAELYFEVYSNRLDHYLYGILGKASTLASIKAASPLLTAAVCTVGALHAGSSDYEACYKEFVNLSAAQTFSKNNTLQEVRALCIGAFWLNEISWILVGSAVRIATEIQLHRSIHKALQGDKGAYERTRLYYTVYVCDHHFSICYGRPPMTRECEAINAGAQLLETEHATEDCARLFSQVRIWTISSRVFETFGNNVDAFIKPSQISQLRRLLIDLDTWRADWCDKFGINQHVGDYPRKGVSLHYHFAKLYLCSHAFRGVGANGLGAQQISPELDEIAHAAVSSAFAVLRTIISDPEMAFHLNGLPLYFDTMIAFAVVFLLKVATRYSFSVRVKPDEIIDQVIGLVATLKNLTQAMYPRHFLQTIANGTETLLEKCRQVVNQNSIAAVPNGIHGFNDTTQADMSLSRDSNWLESPSQLMFFEGYDFLSEQTLMSGLDFDFNFDIALDNQPQ